MNWFFYEIHTVIQNKKMLKRYSDPNLNKSFSKTISMYKTSKFSQIHNLYWPFLYLNTEYWREIFGKSFKRTCWVFLWYWVEKFVKSLALWILAKFSKNPVISDSTNSSFFPVWLQKCSHKLFLRCPWDFRWFSIWIFCVKVTLQEWQSRA